MGGGFPQDTMAAVEEKGLDSWFPAERLEEASAATEEPENMGEARREAYRAFRALPPEVNPLFRKYSYFGGLDALREVRVQPRGGPLRLPEAEAGAVLVLHDPSGSRAVVPDDLVRAGVEVLTPPDLWSHPEDAKYLLEAGEPLREKFRALNRALFNRALYLRVPDDLERPVRVKDVSVLGGPQDALVVRRVIRTGRRSRLLFSEEVYARGRSEGLRLYSSAVHLKPGPDSQVVYLGVHAPDARTVSFYSREARVSTNDRLGWIWAGFDGLRTMLRNESHLDAEGSEVEDLQTMYGDGESAFNNFTEISHEADDTKGQSITRGIFKGRSRGTSRGMMRIQANTRKVVSYLSEHSMLLSREARSESVPGMEILSAKDVRAAHSSAVAPIDPEKVFYLESRGIDEDRASRMIAEGFLSAVLDRAPVDGLREVLYPALDARWSERSLLWPDEGKLPTLPPLSITGWGAIGDWRLDTKLRDTAGRG